jgi:hypothetical protein
MQRNDMHRRDFLSRAGGVLSALAVAPLSGFGEVRGRQPFVEDASECIYPEAERQFNGRYHTVLEVRTVWSGELSRINCL